MPQVVAYRDDFRAGVLSQSMLARVSSEPFGTGLRDSMNMVPTKTGSMVSVPGNYELHPTTGASAVGREEILYSLNGTAKRRIVFTEDDAQAYDLDSPLDGPVTWAGGGDFEMDAEELYEMQVIQLRGMLWIVHHNHAPQTIHLSDAGTLTLDTPTIYTGVSDRYLDSSGGMHGTTGDVAFATNGNYPSVVGYHNTRLWLACTDLNPSTIWASRQIFDGAMQFTGGLALFTRTATQIPGDGIMLVESAMLGSKISFIESSARIIVGTTRAVYYGGSDIVSAVSDSDLGLTEFDLVFGVSVGCHQMRPVSISGSVIFAGTGRRSLYAAQWSQNGLASVDLTRFNPGVLRAKLRTMAVMQSPIPVVWMVLDDGSGLVLSLDAVNGVTGFSPLSRSNMTKGSTAVTRLNQWVSVYYTDDEDRVLWTVSESDSADVHSVLQAPFDPALDGIGDGQPHYVDRGGYVNYPLGAETLLFADIVDGYETVTGIDIWADYAPQSRANTDATGIVIQNEAVDIHYGLPITAHFSPTIPDIPVQGSGQAQVRGISKVVLRLVESYGGAAGPDIDHLSEIVYLIPGEYELGDPLPAVSGDFVVDTYCWNDTDVSITVRQTIPAPIEVAAVILWIAVTEVP